MPGPVRLGVLGCGSITRHVHLKILARLPDVQVTVLAEPDEKHRREAGNIVQRASCVSDFREATHRDDVDAVVITLPSGLHAEAARYALEQGKPIYLEKPIALSVAEAEPLLDASERSGLVAMIGFNYRFHPLHRQARSEIEADAIGSVVGATFSFTAAATYPLPAWKQKRSSGGGGLLDLASHSVDLVRFLLGRGVTAVAASTVSRRGEGDTATLLLHLEDDVLVTVFVSLSATDDDRLTVYGDRGALTIDRLRGLAVERLPVQNREETLSRHMAFGLRPLSAAGYWWQKRRSIGYEPSYEAALRYFVQAVQDRVKPATVSPNLNDGLLSLRVIEAAEQAARTGCTVALPSLPDGKRS